MAFYYIEDDGKTVNLYQQVQDFMAEHGGESQNDPDHVYRVFAIHPDENNLISVSKETGRYIYNHEGKRIHL